MAGYWPSFFFFFCMFMDRDGVEVHKRKKERAKKNEAKKERGQYRAILTEQTWSIKDFYMAFG